MKKNHKAVILLLFVSGAVFSNSLRNEFVYDDEFIIQENNAIRNWDNAKNLFSGKYYALSRERSYWPVVTLSYFLNYSLGKSDTFIYHATNILFHALNAVLIYLLLMLMLGDGSVSLLAALLFAVHPVHTESVTYICGRTDVMAAFFMLLSMYCYLKADKKRALYAVSLVSYGLGLFSKEMIITLPPVLILYDYCFLLPRKGRWKEKLPFYAGYFALSGLYMLGRYTVYYRSAEYARYPGGSIYTAMLTMSKVFVHYMRLLLYPVKLCLDYMSVASSGVDAGVIFSALVIIAVFFLAVKSFRREKTISFSICFYLVTLAPVSNIILPVGVTMAERYLHIPSVGFCVLMAWLSRRYLKAAGTFLMVLVAIFYSALTMARNRDWKDSFSIWQSTLSLVPSNPKVHNYMGMTYYRKGMLDKAIESYKSSLACDADNAFTHNNLGVAYINRGELDKAIIEFREAVRLDPTHISAHNNLAGACFNAGLYDESVREYGKALDLNPYFIDAYGNLGLVYAAMGMYDEAMAVYEKALAVNPALPEISERLRKLRSLPR